MAGEQIQGSLPVLNSLETCRQMGLPINVQAPVVILLCHAYWSAEASLWESFKKA